MSEGTKNTAGNATPLVAAAQPAKEMATPAASVNADDSGYQQRINTLTAQKAHFQEKYEALNATHMATLDAQKTEAERMIDARVKEAVEAFKKTEYEPLATSVKKYEAHFEADIERMKGNLPEGITIPAVFDEWDVGIRHSYLSNLATIPRIPAPSVGAPVNPATAGPAGIIPGSEFKAWQSTNMYDKDARAKFEANKDKMNLAFREGRIDFSK